MTTPAFRRANYGSAEIQTLVEEYWELRELKRKHWILVRLADLEAAVRRLPLPLREAVVLHGVCALPTRRVGEMVGVSHSTVQARYRAGMENLSTLINGGHP
jgi:DNA-directed RNA polymerase specialized sigma24 family protein